MNNIIIPIIFFFDLVQPPGFHCTPSVSLNVLQDDRTAALGVYLLKVLWDNRGIRKHV